MTNARPPRSGQGQRVLLTVAASVVVIAGLKAASDILVPLAVAAFLAIICTPSIAFLGRVRVPMVGARLLRRWRVLSSWLPQGPTIQLGAPAAVLLVVLGLLGAFVGTGVLVGTSVGDFKSTVQDYRSGERDLSPSARSVAGWFKRFPELVGSGNDIPSDDGELPSAGEDGASGPKLALDPDLLLEFGLSLVAGTGALLSSSFLVLMVSALLLLEAAGMPGKLRKAFGSRSGDLREANEVVRKIQRYLWIKTIVSAATGILLGGVCWLCDVEFPVLWGVVAFALNYVPNIGSIIAMVPPMLLAFAQNGVGSAIWVVLGYGTVNVVVGNLVEPLLMGKQLGLSPLVVFLSMVFWGWTWGAIGMFLSVPLTMSVKIFLENTKDLGWIAALMTSAPSTGPPAEEASPPAPRAGGGALEENRPETRPEVGEE